MSAMNKCSFVIERKSFLVSFAKDRVELKESSKKVLVSTALNVLVVIWL